MAYKLKEVSAFVNAINRVDLAEIEVEISDAGALGTLANNSTLKVKIKPPTTPLKEIAGNETTQAGADNPQIKSEGKNE